MQGGVARRLWIAAALAHLALVAGLFVVFRFGPRSGWAVLLLYSPRAVFAVPALITAVFLRGWWRVLPALTAALVLGPLMGLHLHGPGPAGKLRAVTWNVWLGDGDQQAIRAALVAAVPDLVLLQAVGHGVEWVVEGPPFQGFTVLREDQYLLASRWPARRLPGPTNYGWRSWSHFAVDSPFGEVPVFVVRPHSPRGLLRGGLRRAIASDAPEMDSVERNLRRVDAASRDAGALRIVAGDFNLPEGSGIWRGVFAGMQDAFGEVGNGYGYTFPSRFPGPWMRLDRVLIGEGWRGTRAEVIGRWGSTHAGVLVEVERRER